ncbi:hypothetical protein [uncultured Chitinibacter sp.]|uniref:hypothetical protein n=1 Tax=uncultured Chitinibacter sp. TaxID=1214081 RepID=UPI002597EAF9|nr:hypothetical protein [uncultured Chitinibacter sp.]
MKRILLPLIALLCLSPPAWSKPKTGAEWDRCVQSVPEQVFRDSGRFGVDEWVAKHCGATKPLEGGKLAKGDCDRLFEIQQECKRFKADDLWSLSNASRGNANSLLAGPKLEQFDQLCGAVGRGQALPTQKAFSKQYCTQ